jgi:hypothetical protein
METRLDAMRFTYMLFDVLEVDEVLSGRYALLGLLWSCVVAVRGLRIANKASGKQSTLYHTDRTSTTFTHQHQQRPDMVRRLSIA